MRSREVLEDGSARHGFGTDAAPNVCDLCLNKSATSLWPQIPHLLIWGVGDVV